MARQKEPVSVLRAKKAAGKTSPKYTEKVLAERAAKEVKVDYLHITPPPGLSKRQQAEFMRLGTMLLHTGIFTELDDQLLVRYIKELENLKKLDREFSKVMRGKDGKKDWAAIDRVSIVRDRCANKVQKYSEKLGLNVMDRCRITVEQTVKPENKFDKFKKAI
jgi:phage terminase small subunit